MSGKSGLIKKRKAPLPEEVYPSLQNTEELKVGDTSQESDETLVTNETRPRTLPLGEPLGEGKSLDQILSRNRLSLPTTPTESGTSKSSHKNVDRIKSFSDNEVLDLDELNDKVEALYTKSTRYGRKRNSFGGEIRQLKSTSSKGSLPSISSSLNSVSSTLSTEYVDSQMADQEDIVTLTVHVRKFSDALSKLKNVFSGNGSDTESDEIVDSDVNASEEMQVKAHESLGNVLSNLKEVINQYPSLNSKEILAAAGILISKVKSHKYEDNNITDDFYQSIDHLALVFSSSISDFLMGDQEITPNKAGDDGEDCVDEFPEDGDDEDLSEGDMLDESLKLPSKQEHLTDAGLRDQEADLNQVLLRMELGVDFCLQWTKWWSKYVKDIANYVEKRAQLEAEYTKQLTKLAQTTRTSISEESYLPFQSTFFTALDQDLDYSQRCQQTQSAISGSKFMSPLMQRRSVHDRARKDMKDEWTKTCKQLNDSVSSVKASKSIYYKRKQELEKLNTRQGEVKEAKDSVFGTNKGKKEEDLRSKVEEARQFYFNAVEIANQTQADAEKTKERIVAQTKQLVNECDRTFRSVTRKYFDMMHDLAVPTPIHFRTLAESCQGYEPGKQFEEFVRFQQSTARCSTCTLFQFEEYTNSSRISSGPFAQELEHTARMLESPIRAWASSQQQLSDYEGAVSPVPSPSHSPQSSKKSTNGRPLSAPPLSTDDDSEGESKSDKGSLKSRPFRQRRRPKKPASLNKVPLSKNAGTHTFHKIRSPAKCSECESYVFNGFECAQCGLSCHKKCLENLCTVCGHSRRRTSPFKHMKTFGVYFPENGGVPVLIKKCVKEINRRGLRVKGIYRVSGVKSKMESLCQEFETNADSVDLTAQPPHLIASVLKLYIRQMPEPLMTRKLYPELIHLSKEGPHLVPLSYEEYDNEKDKSDFKKILEKLKEILDKLPKSNYLTLSLLIKHLHKVANEEEYNQMSCQNLAIVFGPTILRQESLCNETSTTSLSSLVDMPHQTRIVALLIVNPTELFDDDDDTEETKVEPVVVSSDSESEKIDETSIDDTPVETFVNPKIVDDPVMPDLYGVKSDRVRGEGLSPMDKLQSQQPEEKNGRVTSKINERIDVKGEATIFDDNDVPLPGSLERQNEYSGWVADDDDLSDRENDTENKIGGEPVDIARTTENSYENHTTTEKIAVDQDEENQRSGDKNSIEDQSHTRSSTSQDEQEDDQLTPRSRAKAFSVGRRNSEPDIDILAKRGTALMNVFIDTEENLDNSESRRSRSESLGDIGTKSENNQERYNTSQQSFNLSSDIGLSSTSVPSTTTGKDEAAQNDLTISPAVISDTPATTNNIREGNTTSPNSLLAKETKAVDKTNTAMQSTTHKRKRSATYDNASRRRNFENHQADEIKRIPDHVLAYGARRNQRISVKDKVKQLEERGGRDTAKSTSLTRGNVQNNNNADENAKESDSNIKSNEDNDKQIDMNITDDNITVNRTSNRPHEPLSRISPKQAHRDLLVNSSPIIASSRGQKVNEKFCALKMDISLEPQSTPSSDSSSEDTSCSGVDQTDNKGLKLNSWSGRGLTPRDSNQAPEFV